MPPRNPASRYVVEIRDSAGESLLLTSADWTTKERDLAISAVLRLVGMKAATRLNAKETSLAAAIGRRKQRRRRKLDPSGMTRPPGWAMDAPGHGLPTPRTAKAVDASAVHH